MAFFKSATDNIARLGNLQFPPPSTAFTLKEEDGDEEEEHRERALEELLPLDERGR